MRDWVLCSCEWSDELVEAFDGADEVVLEALGMLCDWALYESGSTSGLICLACLDDGYDVDLESSDAANWGDSLPR